MDLGKLGPYKEWRAFKGLVQNCPTDLMVMAMTYCFVGRPSRNSMLHFPEKGPVTIFLKKSHLKATEHEENCKK